MRPWRGVLIAALTIGLLLLFFRGVDLQGLWRAVAGVRPGWLLLSVALSIAHYPLRAWRWRYLLAPVGKPPYSDLLSFTLIGYALNNLLPARLGEFVRPLLLSRKHGLPGAGALASVFLERILDLFTILLLFAGGLPLLLPSFVAGAQRDSALSVIGWAAGIGVAAVAGIAFLLILLKFRDAAGTRLDGLLRFLPLRLRDLLARLSWSFLQGLASMATRRLLLKVSLSSLIIWLDLSASFWTMARAFDVDLSWPGAFFMMGILATGMAIPTPGGLGGYDSFCSYGLILFFDLAPEPAAGIALLSHAAGLVPATLAGLFCLTREGMTLRGVRALARPTETP